MIFFIYVNERLVKKHDRVQNLFSLVVGSLLRVSRRNGYGNVKSDE